MAQLPPQFLDAVVAIGCKVNGNLHWIGTGFLYGDFIKQVDEKTSSYISFIVTNKHVLVNQNEVVIRLKAKDTEDILEYPLQLTNNGQIQWYGHPSPDIDVAIIKIDGSKLQKDNIQFYFFKSDKDLLKRDEMLENGISAGDDIFLLGYPMGLVDMNSPIPVVRQGIIANMKDPMTPHRFLIDSQNYPGNSGGPVIYKPNFGFLQGTKNFDESRLIGIVKSYVKYQDIAISQQTKEPVLVLSQNSGLANVFHADYIDETVKFFHSTRKGE